MAQVKQVKRISVKLTIIGFDVNIIDFDIVSTGPKTVTIKTDIGNRRKDVGFFNRVKPFPIKHDTRASYLIDILPDSNIDQNEAILEMKQMCIDEMKRKIEASKMIISQQMAVLEAAKI